MNRNKNNFVGTLNVELNLYNIGDDSDEFSLEIVNIDNNQLINKINNYLKYLDIIRNNNKIRTYEHIIKDNEIIINESINRKKQDILEIAKYMISKEKEILYYKKQIDDLNNNIDYIQQSVCDTVNNKLQQPPLTIPTNKKDINNNLSDFNIIDTIKSYFSNDIIEINNINKDNNKVNDKINLKYKNLNCFIELKHNKNNIGKNEIKNYLNFVSGSSYNCGIYISSNSSYTTNSNIKDFDILTINNKPIIFISNLIKDQNKINYSIKLMHYVLNNKMNDEDSIEINTYVQYINKYYDILEHSMDKCDAKINKYNDQINKYETKINDVKNKLNHIIIKKNEYSNEIQSLEEIPTLQLSIVNTASSLATPSVEETIDDTRSDINVEENVERRTESVDANVSNYTDDIHSVTSEEENINVDE